MRVFKDVLNGSDLFTDVQEITDFGCYYHVSSRMIEYDTSMDGIAARLRTNQKPKKHKITMVNDVVHLMNLRHVETNKSEYINYMMEHIRMVVRQSRFLSVREKEAYEREVMGVVGRICERFEQYTLYSGCLTIIDEPNMALRMGEDGLPYFTVLKDSVSVESQ